MEANSVKGKPAGSLTDEGKFLLAASRATLRGKEVDIKEINLSNGYIPGCGGDSVSWSSTFTVKTFNFDPKTNSAAAAGKMHIYDSDTGSKDLAQCLLVIRAKEQMSESEFIEGVREHSMKTWLEKFSYKLFDMSERASVEIDHMGSLVSSDDVDPFVTIWENSER